MASRLIDRYSSGVKLNIRARTNNKSKSAGSGTKKSVGEFFCDINPNGTPAKVTVSVANREFAISGIML
jgi:hypothetical protein